MWNLTSFRLETVLVSVQDRCMNCARCTKAYKSFWMHSMVPQVTRLRWKLASPRLETVLILMQDGCTVCVERATGSAIVLDAPDGTAR